VKSTSCESAVHSRLVAAGACGLVGMCTVQLVISKEGLGFSWGLQEPPGQQAWTSEFGCAFEEPHHAVRYGHMAVIVSRSISDLWPSAH
jgi:hypothetical protein